jgi:hypothetical protein
MFSQKALGKYVIRYQKSIKKYSWNINDVHPIGSSTNIYKDTKVDPTKLWLDQLYIASNNNDNNDTYFDADDWSIIDDQLIVDNQSIDNVNNNNNEKTKRKQRK